MLKWPQRPKRFAERVLEYQRQAKIEQRERDQKADQQKVIAALEGIKNEQQREYEEGKPFEARREKRERRRFWLDVAAVIAVFLAAGFSAAQWGVLRGQLKEMRDQSEFTKSQLRARMGITFGIGSGSSNGDNNIDTWIVTPSWRNGGNTEANRVSGWDARDLFSQKDAASHDFTKSPRDTSKEAVPITIVPGDQLLQQSMLVTTDMINRAESSDDKIIVWGYLEYTDIFFPMSNVHHIHYCNIAVPIGKPPKTAISFPLYRTDCNYSD